MTWFDDSVLRPEVAGPVGALVGLFHTPGKSLRERAFNMVAGLGAAWFLAPWLTSYLSIDAKNGQMAVAFMVGLVGMNLLSKSIEYVKTTSLKRLFNLRAESSENSNSDSN